ncbi:MAG: SGNH/GDSL hydrolase family protein [Ilumatobacteraceae bacterium]
MTVASVVLVAAGAVAETAIAAPVPYEALSPEYVAIGDSYASGVGTRTYYSDASGCQRSPRAYPVIASVRVGATLVFEACVGADTADVLADQLDPLDAATDLVTVMVGGNDAGFSRVITDCAKPWWAANCGDRVDDAEDFINATLPGRLDTVYQQVRSRAPNARVVVVGYPRLFMGEDCNAGKWFSPGEQRDLNATADLLDSVTKARAASHGFAFVDPSAAFSGHAVCDDAEWVNGLSSPVGESYHPNRAGQVGYADLVDNHLD